MTIARLICKRFEFPAGIAMAPHVTQRKCVSVRCKYAARAWYVSEIYGVSVKITGVFDSEPSGVFGKYNVALSSTLSRMRILTPQ